MFISGTIEALLADMKQNEEKNHNIHTQIHKMKRFEQNTRKFEVVTKSQNGFGWEGPIIRHSVLRSSGY